MVKRRTTGLGRGAAGGIGRIREGGRAGGSKASSPRRAAVVATGAEGEESQEEVQLKIGSYLKSSRMFCASNIFIYTPKFDRD